MAKDHDLILHPSTEAAVSGLINKAPHAVLLTGLRGSGKMTVARYLAAKLLNTNPDKLEKYPYLITLAPVDNKAIPIDSVRELQKFLTLKIPGSHTSADISRIVIIENAHLLTTESQNALLKTLEEPPADTVLILTAHSPEALLPTILSRVTTVRVISPEFDAIKQYFNERGFKSQDIDRALIVSGGLPGLTQALLSDLATHPLYEATVQARTLLQAKVYDRLLLVDALSKQKQQAQDICYILGQMSRMALARTADSSTLASKRWQRILRASYDASEQLRSNTQAKLVLMNLMLEL